MKKIFFILLLAVSSIVKAQTIDEDGNVFDADSNKIARVEPTGTMLIKSYRIFNSKNELIIVFNFQPGADGHHEVFFTVSNHKGICNNIFGFRKKIATALVESEILKGNVFNEKREALFMSYFPNGKYLENDVATTTSTSTNTDSQTEDGIVERNKKAEIFVFGTDVKQDLKTIGSVETKQIVTSGGLTKEIKVFNINHKLIATATSENNNNKLYKIITSQNHNRYQVATPNEFDAVEKIIKLLIEYDYL